MDTIVRVATHAATPRHRGHRESQSNPCAAACCGLLFIPLAIVLLWWNEGNSVAAHQALKEAEGLCVGLQSIDAVQDQYEGQLVHATGFAEAGADAVLSDATLGVSVNHTLKMSRSTEMYQWVETEKSEDKHNSDGTVTTTTTYTYRKEWKSTYVNSNLFDSEGAETHVNPQAGIGNTLLEADFGGRHYWTADPINFGAFSLPAVVLAKMNWFQPISPGSLSVGNVPDGVAGENQKISLTGNGFYVGNQGNPQVGDTRISYKTVPEQTISIVAAQVSSSFQPFVTSGDRTVLLVEAGTVSAEVMFVHANEQVTHLTWIIRLVGFLVLWACFHNVAAPLSAAANFIPFLGDLVEGLSCLLSGLITVVVWSIVVALAWLRYRPFMSLSLLAIAGGAAYYIYKKKQQSQGVQAVPVAEAHVVEDDLELQEQQPGGYSDKEIS